MATDMQRDAEMRQSAQYLSQNEYQPQRAAYQNVINGGALYGPQDAPIIDANGYYIPPHAPRLTAAAIRSSYMAASYYNPWLHPMHSLNRHARDGQTWSGNRQTATGQGELAPTTHQQVEDQLRDDNSAVQRADHLASLSHYSAASAYGQEQHQTSQYQPRYSYPDGRMDRSMHWNHNGSFNQNNARAARHSSDATPTTVFASTYQQPHTLSVQQQQNPPDYDQQSLRMMNQYNSGQRPLHQGVTHRNAEAFYCPPQLQQPHNSNQGSRNGHGNDWGSGQDQTRPPNGYQLHAPIPSGYQNNWQQHVSGQVQNQHASIWPNFYTASQCGQNRGTNNWSLHTAGGRTSMQYCPDANGNSDDTINAGYIEATRGQAELLAANSESSISNVAGLDANHHNVNSAIAPPPPSPSTLDRSGVPISSVVSDIIWNACAAFMDPELLALSYQRDSQTFSRESTRGRISSSTSMPLSRSSIPFNDSRDGASPSRYEVYPKHTRAQTHPTQQQGSLAVLHPLHRLTLDSTDSTVNSEDSSASSSEPGTPPSSFPSYLYDDLQYSRDAMQTKDELQSSNLRRMSRFGFHIGHSPDRSTPPLLHRQSSFDQKQLKIIEVLELVSPHWKWSAYDEKLMSLTTSSIRLPANQDEKDRTGGSRLNNRSNSSVSKADELASFSGVNAFGNESSPAFRRFAHQVLAQTLSSPTAVILALLYSLRIPYMAIHVDSSGDSHLDKEAKEIFAQPSSAAPFKLFTLGLMMANKHLDDNTFLNKTWNEVTGISLAEINRMERWFLERSSYEIVVPQETWIMFLQRLGARTDQKLTGSIDKELFRTTSNGHRSSQSLSSIRSNASTLTGLTQEESLKRLLLSIEDALIALGCTPIFQLDESDNAFSRPHHNSFSPHVSNSQRQEPHPRPGHSLQNLHKQSHSAPVLASTSDLATDQVDSDFDVFDDEEGPYRPQRSRHQSSIEKRSVMDYRTSQSSSTVAMQQEQTQKRDQRPQSMYLHDCTTSKNSHKSSTSVDVEAPLAPSILLDLLNRGQQFAHTNR